MNWIPSYDRKAINRHLQQEATRRKAEAETEFFWNIVKGIEPIPTDGLYPFHNADIDLFEPHVEKPTSQSPLDSALPVERSGNQATAAPVLETFEELSSLVPGQVLENLKRMNIETPTPIQKHAIPLGLHGLDLMCCSQTGSGKTVSFLIPMIARLLMSASFKESPEGPTRTRIDERGALPKGVVIAPTRELVSQIYLEAKKLSHQSHLKTAIVYGGADIRPQLVDLTEGCDILVATPGRLSDLVERGVISLNEVDILVLDEADRMLDMGFEPQIRQIVANSGMPAKDKRQTFMFSATFPDDIQVLAKEFLRDYVWIGVGRTGSTVGNIKQVLIQATSDPNKKLALLIEALKQSDGRTLIFVQRKKTASWVSGCLNKHFNVTADEIHGDRSQIQREVALQRFRDGQAKVLVATDVASRGLDIPSVTHVIQFDMPISPEDFDTYIHRIGRTGRMGQPGIATSLFVPGREVGEGNGKIAPMLLRLLKEAQQEIPDWFANLPDHSMEEDVNDGSARNARTYRGTPTEVGTTILRAQSLSSGSTILARNSKFGGRDVRSGTNSYMTYHQLPHTGSAHHSMPVGSVFEPYSNASSAMQYQQMQLQIQHQQFLMQSSSAPTSQTSMTATIRPSNKYQAHHMPQKGAEVVPEVIGESLEGVSSSFEASEMSRNIVEDGSDPKNKSVDRRRMMNTSSTTVPAAPPPPVPSPPSNNSNNSTNNSHYSRGVPPQTQNHQAQQQFMYSSPIQSNGELNMIPMVQSSQVLYTHPHPHPHSHPQTGVISHHPYPNTHSNYALGNVGYIGNVAQVAPSLANPTHPMLVATGGAQYHLGNTVNSGPVAGAQYVPGGYVPVFYNPYQTQYVDTTQYYHTIPMAQGTTFMTNQPQGATLTRHYASHGGGNGLNAQFDSMKVRDE